MILYLTDDRYNEVNKMIKMPLDQLMQKLKEKSGLTEEELNVRLQQKMDQLSGLISREGAAHIVANEIGVQLFEKISGDIKIKDLMEGMREVTITGVPVKVFEVKQFTTRDGREGRVGSFVLGDETGTIRVACWNDKAELLSQVTEKETVLKISDGFLKSNQGKLELHLNDRAQVVINPPGVKVENIPDSQDGGSFQKAVRKKVSELAGAEENVEILGTIVQVFDPKFYEVCPECAKRARPRDGAIFCDAHGEVAPAYSYLVSFFLDDGTDNIRVTCFRNTAQRLCAISEDEMQACREDPSRFEDAKTELLGQIVKVVGRVKRNDMFDRMEFTANLVFTNPDPENG